MPRERLTPTPQEPNQPTMQKQPSLDNPNPTKHRKPLPSGKRQVEQSPTNFSSVTNTFEKITRQKNPSIDQKRSNYSSEEREGAKKKGKKRISFANRLESLNNLAVNNSNPSLDDIKAGLDTNDEGFTRILTNAGTDAEQEPKEILNKLIETYTKKEKHEKTRDRKDKKSTYHRTTSLSYLKRTQKDPSLNDIKTALGTNDTGFTRILTNAGTDVTQKPKEILDKLISHLTKTQYKNKGTKHNDEQLDKISNPDHENGKPRKKQRTDSENEPTTIYDFTLLTQRSST